MSKNNLKLLERNDLEIFVNKYEFTIHDQYVIVSVKTFNRPTLHDKNKSFAISCNNRKLIITPEAINLWENHFRDRNLIEVQNALNTIILMYQSPNPQDVEKILNKEI